MRYEELTVEFLKANYLFGIPLQDVYGNVISDDLLIHYLNSAIIQAERTFHISIKPIDIEEEIHDYFACDYNNWGYLKTLKKPIISVSSMGMYFGQNKMVDIPLDWIRYNSITGQIQLFPVSGTANSVIITQSGSFLPYTLGMYQYAPQLWKLSYRAGFEDIPEDLLEYLCKRACIGILQVWGDLIIGAGIANQTISLDGLSQSIGTTQSPEFSGAGARIKNYQDDLKRLESLLKDTYVGVNMIVV